MSELQYHVDFKGGAYWIWKCGCIRETSIRAVPDKWKYCNAHNIPESEAMIEKKLLSIEEAQKYLDLDEGGEEAVEAVRTAYLHGYEKAIDELPESGSDE